MHWQSPFPVYFLSATFKIKTAHLLSPPNFFLTLIVNDIFFSFGCVFVIESH